MLAQKLYEEGPRHSEAWNFGPDDSDAKPVEWLVRKICAAWGSGASYEIDKGAHPHEAHYLKLDCSKAKAALGWRPLWDLEKAIDSIIEWSKAYQEKKDVREMCFRQIEEYVRVSREQRAVSSKL
jgi:CDP-glucose 4,6-dehydratase